MNEQHLTEEQLILYRLGEAPNEAAAKHLAACDACRRELELLDGVLQAVNAAPVPEPPEGYEQNVWLRLRPRLNEKRRWWMFLGARASRPQLRWAEALVMAMLLVGAFLAGRYWPKYVDPTGTEMAHQPIPQQVRERILLVTVAEHLERSQMVLIELANAGESAKGQARSAASQPVDISAEQQWAQELLSANRLYRQTAAFSGQTGVATVLDELERVLLEIAHSPAQLSHAELASIRQRIEAQGILFKVRVIGSRIREGSRMEPRQETARERL